MCILEMVGGSQTAYDIKCLWGTSTCLISSPDTGTRYRLLGGSSEFVAQGNSGTHPHTERVGGLLQGGKTVGT